MGSEEHTPWRCFRNCYERPSLLRAATGAVAGGVIAVVMSRMLSAYFLPGTDRVSVLTDGRTAGYMAVVAVGLVTGHFPLIQARRLTLRDDLAGGARAGHFRRSVARPASNWTVPAVRFACAPPSAVRNQHSNIEKPMTLPTANSRGPLMGQASHAWCPAGWSPLGI